MKVLFLGLAFFAWLRPLAALPTAVYQASFNLTSGASLPTSRDYDTVRQNLTRVHRPPPRKAAPIALGSNIQYGNVDIVGAVLGHRPPPPKPKPTGPVNNNLPGIPEKPNDDCGLVTPTAQGLEDIREEFNTFVKVNFDQWQQLPEEVSASFYTYMRENYAVNTARSNLICDAVGTCGIANCRSLSENLEPRLRQLAYYFFEQVAGVDYLHASISKASKAAGNYMYRRAREMVDKYSTVDEIKKSLEIRQNREKAILPAVTSFALLGLGALGAGTGFQRQPPFPLKISQGAWNLATDGYLGITGQITANRPGVPDPPYDLQQWLETRINSDMHDRNVAIDDDLKDLMIGAPNHLNETIVDVLTTGNFLEPDPEFQTRLRELEERYLYAVHVNTVWSFDRAYIVETNTLNCEHDNRGPYVHRVCLPEFRNRAYWIYNIDQSREGHKYNTHVGAPSGLHTFDTALPATHNITFQDIVRSSQFMHRNNLAEAIHKVDVNKLSEVFRNEGLVFNADAELDTKVKNLGKVPGAFTVPICRNPQGEAISSVYSGKKKNYPCMCGEFGWNDPWGGWSLAKDETKRFLKESKFMYSEDWEGYCGGKSHNHCVGDESYDLHNALNLLRDPSDPPIPKKIKWPFGKCTKHYDPTGNWGDPAQGY